MGHFILDTKPPDLLTGDAEQRSHGDGDDDGGDDVVATGGGGSSSSWEGRVS